ncbi:hypothetical protein CONCODRAFT_12606, partial [Conidiobolus coronatus NRRL 28638]
LTNPIIHRRIKLTRSEAILNKVHSNCPTKIHKIEAEIDEFIANNAKHAHLAKEFVFFENVLIRKLVEFFETFKYITILEINSIQLSEFEFLGAIKPLTKLHELNLHRLRVYRNHNYKPFPLAIELPTTLTNLTLYMVSATSSPESFIKTINSHTNLLEFKCHSNNQNEFLNPFYKSYPTLKVFEYRNQYLNSHSLYDIIGFHPQLLSLDLELKCWNSALANHINHHLINLEKLTLRDVSNYNTNQTIIFLNFAQLTKIKKLNITCANLSSCSLESIFLKCPDLEELGLMHYNSYLCVSLNLSINFNMPIKIKKLTTDCNVLTESSFDKFLLRCSNLKILDIQLHRDLKPLIKLIATRCTNLEHLTIFSGMYLGHADTKAFYDELTTNSSFKSTLTYLALKRLNIIHSKAEYFESFTNIKRIVFLSTARTDMRKFKKSEAENSVWPNFKSTITEHDDGYDIELFKLAV